MPVHIYTPTDGVGGDSRVIVVHETDDGREVYEFRVEESGGEKRAAFQGSPSGSESVPDAVEEGLEAAGYTVADEDADTDDEGDPRTDGGDNIKRIFNEILGELRAAEESAHPASDEPLKRALDSVLDLREQRVTNSEFLQEWVTKALVNRRGEGSHFVELAIDLAEYLAEHHDDPDYERSMPGTEGIDEEPPAVVEETDVSAEYVDGSQDAADVADVEDDVLPTEKIRESLHAAKEASGREFDEHIKDAIGEAVWLNARPVSGTGSLLRRLNDVLVAPDEEAPHFINQLLNALEGVEEDLEDANTKPEDEEAGDTDPSAQRETSDDRPPESVRWLDDDHGVVEVETTAALIEWFELEAEQNDFDDIEDWILAQLWVALTQDLHDHHGFTSEIEVEVPHEFARRVSLWWSHRQTEGEPTASDLDAFVFNHMKLRPEWTLSGEPWGLVEQACSEGGDETDA